MLANYEYTAESSLSCRYSSWAYCRCKTSRYRSLEPGYPSFDPFFYILDSLHVHMWALVFHILAVLCQHDQATFRIQIFNFSGTMLFPSQAHQTTADRSAFYDFIFARRMYLVPRTGHKVKSHLHSMTEKSSIDLKSSCFLRTLGKFAEDH